MRYARLVVTDRVLMDYIFRDVCIKVNREVQTICHFAFDFLHELDRAGVFCQFFFSLGSRLSKRKSLKASVTTTLQFWCGLEKLVVEFLNDTHGLAVVSLSLIFVFCKVYSVLSNVNLDMHNVDLCCDHFKERVRAKRNDTPALA